MSIEDVSYLHTHSVLDSVLFFADSSTRDQTHYPSPAEYVLEFTEPVRLVTGLEVIDATIPCTMYAIDSFNDRLDIVTSPDLTSAGAGPTDVQVRAYLFELGASAVAVALLESDGRADLLIVDAATAAAAHESVVPVSQVTLTSVPMRTHALCVRTVYASVTLSLLPSSSNAQPLTAGRQQQQQQQQQVFTANGVAYSIAVDTPLAAAIAAHMVIFPSSSPQVSSVTKASSYGVDGTLYDVVLYDIRSTTADSLAAALKAGVGALCRLRKYSLHISNGNYTVGTLQVQVTQQMSTEMIIDSADTGANSSFAIFAADTRQAIDSTSRVQLASQTPRAFYLNARSSTARSVMGFATQALGTGDGYVSVPFADNLQFFSAIPCISSTVGTVTTSDVIVPTVSPPPAGCTYALRAPGIVNLLGPRFITLRCPEIEKYMYSGMTHGRHSTGIGIFKLPSAGEVSNLRFDFTSLARKPFHPIGRMTRLTLRFERDDGILYDFKGADNTLLLSVRFLAPTGAKPEEGASFVRSILNPDYNPDFLAWHLNAGAPADAREVAEGTDIETNTDQSQSRQGDNDAPRRRRMLLENSIARRLLLEQQRYSY